MAVRRGAAWSAARHSAEGRAGIHRCGVTERGKASPDGGREEDGAPPKPKGEAKEETLTLRLTKDERRSADLAAKRVGLPVSEWARRAIVGAFDRET